MTTVLRLVLNIYSSVICYSPIILIIAFGIILQKKQKFYIDGYNIYGVKTDDLVDYKYAQIRRASHISAAVYPFVTAFLCSIIFCVLMRTYLSDIDNYLTLEDRMALTDDLENYLWNNDGEINGNLLYSVGSTAVAVFSAVFGFVIGLINSLVMLIVPVLLYPIKYARASGVTNIKSISIGTVIVSILLLVVCVIWVIALITTLGLISTGELSTTFLVVSSAFLLAIWGIWMLILVRAKWMN